jgi:hypothetical protein
MMSLICREAACRQQANEMNDAMNAFHNAAKSYKKSDPEGEKECLSQPDESCGNCVASDYKTPRTSWKLPSGG